LADLVHEVAGSGLSATPDSGEGRELFTAKAMELIAHITPGVLRIIGLHGCPIRFDFLAKIVGRMARDAVLCALLLLPGVNPGMSEFISGCSGLGSLRRFGGTQKKFL
jgi:hypothetical protein